ncbi:MAG: hypothetical protein JW741_08330 [Sedimentisphaerales bacterium]|nr:hypothetical protein [Sedimentisphaerales bacterium]
MIRDERIFAAPWSASVWAITVAVCVVVLPVAFVAVAMICARARANGATEAWVLFVAGIPTTIVVLCILLAPLRYTASASAVLVKRLGPNVVIPMENIHQVRRLAKKDLGIGIRLFGSGGFLGGFGIFLCSRLGIVYAYVTDAARLVLIECVDGRKYLLSPETPEEFVEAVETYLRTAQAAGDLD